MNFSLHLIGAGEYTSFEEGESHAYLRFRDAGGREFSLACSEEQIRAVMEFAAGAPAQPDLRDAAAPERPAEPAPVRRAAPIREEGGDPNITDEDDDNVVQLHSQSPFASREDRDL